MDLTMEDDQHQVTINRGTAAAAREYATKHGHCRRDGLRSVFGQIFSQLGTLSGSALRRKERVWKVSLEGEGAQDAGGPYRETVSESCRDLMTDATPLFIQTPNGRADHGLNRDLRMPNPGAASPQHLAMFRFVGCLIGIALRTKHPLGGLRLPSLFWRPLVGETPEALDLALVDTLLIQGLENYRQSHIREAWEAVEQAWTVVSADGRVVPLRPNGVDAVVPFDDRAEYTDAALNFRLAECDMAVAAVREGLYGIVPGGVVQMLTAKELETAACGRPEIDIAKLKLHTHYSQCTADTPAVRMFWEVLEGFSHEDRAQFLAFVWGRTRLPQSDADWKQHFTMRVRDSDDHRLPTAATCSFAIILPAYSSVEVMRSKLSYAIHNARAIDTDFAATGVLGEEADDGD